MNYFFEIHKDLPREGPGDTISTRKAWLMCSKLPNNPRILDIGCGPGMQSNDLINISSGAVIGLDTHFPFLLDCRNKFGLKKKNNNLFLVNASMENLPFEANTFDVIWSEGAIYIMGFEKGLRTFHPILKKNGCIAVTELSWIAENPPDEIIKYWTSEYPGIRTIKENINIIFASGFELIGHFTLPESSWMDNYYKPILERVQKLQTIYQDDPDFQNCAVETIREIEMFKKYSAWYGYEFYIMRSN